MRWTQAEAAKRLGVTRLSVARYETGTRKIPEPVARLWVRLVAEARAKGKRGRAPVMRARFDRGYPVDETRQCVATTGARHQCKNRALVQGTVRRADGTTDTVTEAKCALHGWAGRGGGCSSESSASGSRGP